MIKRKLGFVEHFNYFPHLLSLLIILLTQYPFSFFLFWSYCNLGLTVNLLWEHCFGRVYDKSWLFYQVFLCLICRNILSGMICDISHTKLMLNYLQKYYIFSNNANYIWILYLREDRYIWIVYARLYMINGKIYYN